MDESIFTIKAHCVIFITVQRIGYLRIERLVRVRMRNKVDKKILEAALEVIAREKISGTRMHMIAEAAGMSQASVYYHFATKDILLNAILDNLQESYSEDRKKYVDLNNKSDDENIKGFFDQKKNEIINKKKIDYTQLDFWVQGTTNVEIRDKFRATFNIWRDSIKGSIERDRATKAVNEMDISMVPYIMISLMLGASLQFLIDEDSFDLTSYFDISEKIVNALRLGEIGGGKDDFVGNSRS